uniref:THAP domain-containing protein 1 n=1 Tax=Sinocyclocheilus grahami TaxID=75366 RepID=A0A672PEU3_SINGR
MPGICCAVGCNNSRQRNPELQFYSIPKELDRRNKWLALIRRDHWQPTSNSRLLKAKLLV